MRCPRACVVSCSELNGFWSCAPVLVSCRYVSNGVLRLSKEEVDKAHKDGKKRFSPGFSLEFHFRARHPAL